MLVVGPSAVRPSRRPLRGLVRMRGPLKAGLILRSAHGARLEGRNAEVPRVCNGRS